MRASILLLADLKKWRKRWLALVLRNWTWCFSRYCGCRRYHPAASGLGPAPPLPPPTPRPCARPSANMGSSSSSMQPPHTFLPPPLPPTKPNPIHTHTCTRTCARPSATTGSSTRPPPRSVSVTRCRKCASRCSRGRWRDTPYVASQITAACDRSLRHGRWRRGALQGSFLTGVVEGEEERCKADDCGVGKGRGALQGRWLRHGRGVARGAWGRGGVAGRAMVDGGEGGRV